MFFASLIFTCLRVIIANEFFVYNRKSVNYTIHHSNRCHTNVWIGEDLKRPTEDSTASDDLSNDTDSSAEEGQITLF